MTSNQTVQPEILQNYELLKKLGSGAYGHVWKVCQKSTQKVFALKKIFEAFQHATDAQRTFRQISILKKIFHKNIVTIHEVFVAQNERDIYLIFQYMQTDLYHAIYENILEPIHKKYVLYQLLIGVQYLHYAGLIHRDLKPSNILLDSNCASKICDFGLARLLGYKDQNVVMTEGVATRWYRAPEVLLGSSSYGQKADIWSIGCIMAQILIKNPMFPGSSTINQLQKILQFTGKPQHQDILSIQCEYSEKFIDQCGNFKQKSSKQFFGNADSLLIDLIYKVLQFNPSKRLSINKILQHGFFCQFYNENDLKFNIRKTVQLEVNDNLKLTTDQYKDLIYAFDLKRKIKAQNNDRMSTQITYTRAQSVQRDRSPLNNNSSRVSKSRISEVSPSSKSPQRFRQLKKIREPSFSKILGSQRMKKRSDSRDSNVLIDTQGTQKKNFQLFSDLVKNKDSNRHGSKSRSRLNDKQNIQTNNLSNMPVRAPVNNCLKRFESQSTTSRVSFQGLKKTANVKFNR